MIQRYPEDDKLHGTLAIKLPFSSNETASTSGAFNMSRTTEGQAISNFINLLFTKQTERVMRPNFGVGIQYRLFEQVDDKFLVELGDDIDDQATVYLPYIHVIGLHVNNVEDSAGHYKNMVSISIEFRVTEQGANKLIDVSINESGRVQDLEVRNVG